MTTHYNTLMDAYKDIMTTQYSYVNALIEGESNTKSKIVILIYQEYHHPK